jgi:hypothetical protein
MLGWAAVACGGGTATNAAPDATEEQPPSNSDQAPSDTDSVSSADQPPSNPDNPPSNAGDPAGSGGGRLEQLCKRICDTIDTLVEDCSDGMTDIGMGDACSADVNCQIPPNTPCQDEIADAFECIFDNLSTICSDQPSQGQGARPCNDVGERFTDCARDNGLIDTPGDGNGNGNGNGNNPPSCTPQGGCECNDECLTCSCEAGTNLEELQACAAGACAP